MQQIVLMLLLLFLFVVHCCCLDCKILVDFVVGNVVHSSSCYGYRSSKISE